MKHLRDVVTCTPEETEAVGRQLAEQMRSEGDLPPFVALYGDLGVGKTAFVRGFASVIAPASLVRSPTFALVNEYHAAPLSLFHFDMYRIEDEDDLYSIGFYDYLDRAGICMVEWSENIPYALPSAYVRVIIEKNDPQAPHSRSLNIDLVQEDDP